MFSGIIAHMGKVENILPQGEGIRLVVQSACFADPEDPIKIGESVAHNGVCLTVVETDPAAQTACFDIATETQRCTTVGEWQPGALLNLERSLRLQDRIDGHLVQGHVDCIARVEEIALQTSTYRLRISYPGVVRPLLAPKGAVTLDGVSLTIGSVTNDWFEVFIIPHTWRVTRFHLYERGTQLNLEADCLARYVLAALKSMNG